MSGPLRPPRHAKLEWQQVCLPVTNILSLLPTNTTGCQCQHTTFRASQISCFSPWAEEGANSLSLPQGWQETDHTQTIPFGSLASALDKKKKLAGEEVVKNMAFGYPWSQLSGEDGHESAHPLSRRARVCSLSPSLVFDGWKMKVEQGQKAHCEREHI